MVALELGCPYRLKRFPSENYMASSMGPVDVVLLLVQVYARAECFQINLWRYTVLIAEL